MLVACTICQLFLFVSDFSESSHWWWF